MSLPPDDILAAAFHEDAEPADTEAMVRAIEPAADSLRNAVAQVRLVDIAAATPAQRGGIVALRQSLHRAIVEASTIVDTIDMAFKTAAAATGAKQITAGDAGVVRIEQRGEWKVDVPAMRQALEGLVDAGVITTLELEAAFTTEITQKVDNRKLKYLADNRGEEVRLTIDAHRVYLVNPQSARLTYATPSPSER